MKIERGMIYQYWVDECYPDGKPVEESYYIANGDWVKVLEATRYGDRFLVEVVRGKYAGKSAYVSGCYLHNFQRLDKTMDYNAAQVDWRNTWPPIRFITRILRLQGKIDKLVNWLYQRGIIYS